MATFLQIEVSEIHFNLLGFIQISKQNRHLSLFPVNNQYFPVSIVLSYHDKFIVKVQFVILRDAQRLSKIIKHPKRSSEILRHQ